MTTPKEALERARTFVSHAPGSNAESTLRMIDEALASLEGDAVERVARIISRAMLDNPTGDTSEERAAKRKAIATEYAAAYVADLATGLVAGEAAIRADEREKCAKVADEFVTGEVTFDDFCDGMSAGAKTVAAAIRSGGLA